MPLYFHYELPGFALKEQHILKNWIFEVVSEYKKSIGNLNFIFASNDYLLDINKKYLNHNYYTDVISFDDSEDGVISGDIFISIDQVKINSKEHNVGFINELCRVMIHGVLHLIGYGDSNASQKLTMRKNEDHALALLEVIRDGKDI